MTGLPARLLDRITEKVRLAPRGRGIDGIDSSKFGLRVLPCRGGVVMTVSQSGLTGAAVFDRWSAAQLELHRYQPDRSRRRGRFNLGLSPASVTIYQSIWRGWLDWLNAEQLSWNTATSDDVERFLVIRAPSDAGRPAINWATMAQYTRQRYFRVLQGVYRHATVLGIIERNPVSPVEEEGHQPQVREVDRQSQVLPPGALALLRDAKWLTQAIPQQRENAWWVLRDRACVSLTAHCGLKTSELRLLQGRDLRLGAAVYQGQPTEELPSVSRAGGLFVDVRDGTDRVTRSVPLPHDALEVLDPWLAARRLQLRRVEGAGVKGTLSTAKVAPAERAPLFLASTRNAAKATGNGELTAAMLYRVFRACLEVAYTMVPAKPDHDQYVATGAAIVRNSVIAEWVETNPETAAELAGLKSLDGWVKRRAR